MTPLEIATGIVIKLVGAIHLCFMYMEMFLWEKPKIRKLFGSTREFASQTRNWPVSEIYRLIFYLISITIKDMSIMIRIKPVKGNQYSFTVNVIDLDSNLYKNQQTQKNGTDRCRNRHLSKDVAQVAHLVDSIKQTT
jgi:hypothetical protein